jgi:hypothetical protein
MVGKIEEKRYFRKVDFYKQIFLINKQGCKQELLINHFNYQQRINKNKGVVLKY